MIPSRYKGGRRPTGIWAGRPGGATCDKPHFSQGYVSFTVTLRHNAIRLRRPITSITTSTAGPERRPKTNLSVLKSTPLAFVGFKNATDHIPFRPEHIHLGAIQIPFAANHIPSGPILKPSVPGHIPFAPGHIHSAVIHIHSGLKHIRSKPRHIPFGLIHIPFSAIQKPPRPNYIPSKLKHIPFWPILIQFRANHIPFSASLIPFGAFPIHSSTYRTPEDVADPGHDRERWEVVHERNHLRANGSGGTRTGIAR